MIKFGKQFREINPKFKLPESCEVDKEFIICRYHDGKDGCVQETDVFKNQNPRPLNPQELKWHTEALT